MGAGSSLSLFGTESASLMSASVSVSVSLMVRVMVRVGDRDICAALPSHPFLRED